MFIKGRVAVAERPDGTSGEIEESALAPGQNAIFISPKMNFGQRTQSLDLMFNFAGGLTKAAMGAFNRSIMQINIIGWQGADFDGVPVSPETIDQLDYDEPLVEAVLEAINKRNPMKRADAKK